MGSGDSAVVADAGDGAPPPEASLTLLSRVANNSQRLKYSIMFWSCDAHE